MKKISNAEEVGGENSNLELLRIILMLAIIANHYVVNSGLSSYLKTKEVLDIKDTFFILFGCGGKTAINCFVIIRSYFMCKKEATLDKFVKLLFEVLFYKIIIYFAFLMNGMEHFSIFGLSDTVNLFLTISDNFVGCFLLFYLFIPFLTKAVSSMNQREHCGLMILSVVVFSILPSTGITSIRFNYITWFSILFVIASYIRFYPKEIYANSRLLALAMLMMIFVSYTSVVTIAYFQRSIKRGMGLGYFFVADSNKILALLTAVSVFLFFQSLDLKNEIINKIAASTFGVFLIHANSNTMRKWLWEDVCNVVGTYNRHLEPLYACVCVISIFVICSIIDTLRGIIFKLIQSRLNRNLTSFLHWN